MPAGSIFLTYSYFHTMRILIVRCKLLYWHAKNLQFVISFFLFLSFNCSYEGGSYKTMCFVYKVASTFYYLSRLDNLSIFKLEKEKKLHSLTKSNSAVHLPVNRIPTCTEAVDQHQQLGGRLKHFLHLVPIYYVNLVKNKHRGDLSIMSDL